MCAPNWKEIDCGTKEAPNFITNYECEGNADFISALSKNIQGSEIYSKISTTIKRHPHTSFFSGHASVAWSSASFIFFYLKAKFQGHSRKSFIANTHKFIQLVCIGLALYVSYSRIDDYWHHPTDVLTGSIVGIACQYINVRYLMQLYWRQSIRRYPFFKGTDIF